VPYVLPFIHAWDFQSGGKNFDEFLNSKRDFYNGDYRMVGDGFRTCLKSSPSKFRDILRSKSKPKRNFVSG